MDADDAASDASAGRAVMSSTVAYKAGLIDRNGNPAQSAVKRCETRKLSHL